MHNNSKYLPWLVCFSAALFFFYEFIQMNMFNAISPELMRDFSVNATQLGYLSATYLYADVVFLFPAGMLLDRFSTRHIILLAMLICIAGTLGFALAHSFWLASLCHFMAGIGNAFCFLSCMMLASRWFPPRRMAVVTGLIVTMAMAGGVVAQTPMTLLSAAIGWRHALIANAGLGLAIMAIIWLFVRDYPSEYAAQHQQQKESLHALGFWKGIKQAVSNAQTWLCGIYTSLLNLPIMLLGALWGSLYLMQVHHISAEDASLATSMIFIGTIVGGPVIGWISDHLGLRRLPMLVGGVLSLIVVFSIMYLPQPSLKLLLVLFFALGFFTSSQVISYPVIAESTPKSLTGTSMGLASVLIMGGGALFQPIFGGVMDKFWDGTIINGVHQYTLASFQPAMMILPIAFGIGLLAALFIRETHCKAMSENDLLEGSAK
jgi:MFS family permease